MLEILQQLLAVVALVVRGLLSILVTMGRLVQTIPVFTSFIFASLTSMPPVVVSFIILGITGSIVLLILGRN